MLNFLNSTKCGPGLAKDFALVRMLKEQAAVAGKAGHPALHAWYSVPCMQALLA